MSDSLPAWLTADDVGLTALICALSLLAVWVPFYRGLVVCFRARAATRRVEGSELRGGGRARRAVEPLGILMLRTLQKSLGENARQGVPSEFVVDATRQYALNEYEAQYSRLISMYSNLLPPIGFIGTTGGLLVLFLSMHLEDTSLELGALAIALTSSIIALMGFAVLEGLKIRLYGRLLSCLDHVLSLQRAAEESRRAKAAAAAPAR